MTFSIHQAYNICAHYQYLVGNNLDDRIITHVFIEPFEAECREVFLKLFLSTKDFRHALENCSYNPGKVRIVVGCIDHFTLDIIANDLNTYLSKNNIDKIYARMFF